MQDRTFMNKTEVSIENTEILSDDWYSLTKTTFSYRRRDGKWQTLTRESYDRGNGATVLLYNLERGTVVLTRQFRYPTFVNGNADGRLIEAAAGLLDDAHPAERIRKEAEEETGYRLNHIDAVFEAYMSPGSVTERLYFFTAAYQDSDRITSGGGNYDEGEDIEVLELSLKEALSMVNSGDICDGKTIMLLQHAALHLFKVNPSTLYIGGDA